MTNAKSTKRALLTSVMALILCFTMLLGTTFAWFTDSVTSAGNIIQSGTLDVSLEHADEALSDADDAKWVDASTGAIFSYDNWEPGYTAVKYVKIENEGTLDLKFILNIVPNNAAEEVNLADVIEVYMVSGAVAVERDALTTDSEYFVGSLTTLMNETDGAAHGVLYADDADKPEEGNVYEIYTIALKMSTSAGNEYMGKNVGGGFSVLLLATQLASESDSFNNQYDADADYLVSVSNENELIAALAAGEKIELTGNVTITEPIVLPTDGEAVINGNGFSLVREASNTGHLLSIGENAALTLNNVILDGGNIESTGNLIYVDSNSTLTLNDGAVIQNYNGSDSAIHTDGSTTIVMNDGSVIQNNYSTAAAPAITGGLQTTFKFNGGKITGNKTTTGGASAIWSGNWAVMTISGDFELTNNYSEAGSSAIRFASQSHFRMNDGTISGNTNAENKGGAIYGWNTSMELFGGTITDNGANAIDFDGGRGMTIGETNTVDTIVFGMSTNHDRVYLAENFGTIHFDFDGTNTPASNLNFVPAEGYVYTEGDEDRLICEHEGYSTYWDVESNTFKLQAAN